MSEIVNNSPRGRRTICVFGFDTLKPTGGEVGRTRKANYTWCRVDSNANQHVRCRQSSQGYPFGRCLPLKLEGRCDFSR